MDHDLFARIVDARRAFSDALGPAMTPLDFSPGLSAWLGCEVYLKCEHLQTIGSFKIRGASNKIRLLTAQQKQAGVTTASTGNHGKAVACAAKKAGVVATVYVARETSPAKIDGIRAYGAEVVVIDGPPIDAELAGRAAAAAQGKTYISPYNDRDVMAGQGTMGLELLEQLPDLDAVFLSVGGGGLIGGLGTAVKTQRPQAQIVGVWPENSAAMLRSLEAGEIVETDERPTLSTSTAGAVEPGAVTFDVCRQVIDKTIEVSEAQIAAAMAAIARHDQWMVEGAAGVPLAGLVKQARAWRGRKIVIVLCGRNIALDVYLGAIDAAMGEALSQDQASATTSTMTLTPDEIKPMFEAERIAHIGKLLDNMSDGDVPLHRAQAEEMERRLENFELNVAGARRWEDFKATLSKPSE